jgi:hypothetical protein
MEYALWQGLGNEPCDKLPFRTNLLPPRSPYCQLTNIFQHLLKMKAAAVAVLCFILAAAAVEGYAPVPARAVLGST